MIFVDTGAFVARHLERDQYHERALDGWRRARAHRIVTTSHVLDEALTLLGRRAGNAFAAERGRRILTSHALRLVRPDLEDELSAVTLFESFADQGVSFTDALSFAVMRRLGIARVFGFDRHFALAGFELWPES
ncbi:MAG: PIN domain-containing protein [Myxococcales bacterium]|nr:PIN domain-containing protein [Myxococcales bacterium]